MMAPREAAALLHDGAVLPESERRGAKPLQERPAALQGVELRPRSAAVECGELRLRVRMRHRGDGALSLFGTAGLSEHDQTLTLRVIIDTPYGRQDV
jgi:hypothetical protein